MSHPKLPQEHRHVRNFLLEPFLQIPFGLIPVGISIVFSILLGGVLYGSLSHITEFMFSLTDLESQAKEIYLDELSQVFWWIVLIVFGFIFAQTIAAIAFTHRLIGPIVSFRKQIQLLIDEDYSQRVVLRKKDAFKELAADINALTDRLDKQ